MEGMHQRGQERKGGRYLHAGATHDGQCQENKGGAAEGRSPHKSKTRHRVFLGGRLQCPINCRRKCGSARLMAMWVGGALVFWRGNLSSCPNSQGENGDGMPFCCPQPLCSVAWASEEAGEEKCRAGTKDGVGRAPKTVASKSYNKGKRRSHLPHASLVVSAPSALRTMQSPTNVEAQGAQGKGGRGEETTSEGTQKQKKQKSLHTTATAPCGLAGSSSIGGPLGASRA